VLNENSCEFNTQHFQRTLTSGSATMSGWSQLLWSPVSADRSLRALASPPAMLALSSLCRAESAPLLPLPLSPPSSSIILCGGERHKHSGEHPR
jgi:hypothetical protein